jgi:hypothetical protein
MAFNIQRFRDTFDGDGARPNLFKVKFNHTTYGSSGTEFFCRASSIPGSTIGTVSVPYAGREIKFAGNRTFPDWTTTFINDEDYSYRSFFESWIEDINGNVTNRRLSNRVGVDSYHTGGSTVVQQYSKDGTTVLREYSVVNLFPIDISEITLDWSDNDSIEEFTVTFSSDYWTVAGQTDNGL